MQVPEVLGLAWRERRDGWINAISFPAVVHRFTTTLAGKYPKSIGRPTFRHCIRCLPFLLLPLSLYRQCLGYRASYRARISANSDCRYYLRDQAGGQTSAQHHPPCITAPSGNCGAPFRTMNTVSRKPSLPRHHAEGSRTPLPHNSEPRGFERF